MSPPVISKETVEENRTLILDAAENRYREYGYDKTTMAEIAGDIGMSAANLYRYFKNKHEIGCACAQRCMMDRIDVLKGVVEKEGMSATEKLREYAVVSFEELFHAAGQEAKLNGLVQQILAEHVDMVKMKVQAQIDLITMIIEQGVTNGEFVTSSPAKTARDIQTALVLFDVPIFMNLYSYEEFQEMVNGVIDLILSGLASRG